MTLTNLYLEHVLNTDDITKITNKIINRYVIPFTQSETLKAKHYDITYLFDVSKSTIKHIQLLLVLRDIVTGEASVEDNKKNAKITLQTSKRAFFKKDYYYYTLRHEVIHILDYLKSNGEQTNYGYLDIESKYKHEKEFNEKIHEIALYLKNKLHKDSIKYENKEQILEMVKKATGLPHTYFYSALIKYPNLYQKLLKRLTREGILQ